MKVNFSLLQLKDIDGKVVKEGALHKTIANALWHNAENLDLIDIAMAINRGKAVDLGKRELSDIESAVKDPKSGIFAFARKQIFDFIDKARAKAKDKSN